MMKARRMGESTADQRNISLYQKHILGRLLEPFEMAALQLMTAKVNLLAVQMLMLPK